MCPFVVDKGPERRAYFCAECHREWPALQDVSTVVEKEANQSWFPGEQNVCKRDSLDIGTVGQKQFDEI